MTKCKAKSLKTKRLVKNQDDKIYKATVFTFLITVLEIATNSWETFVRFNLRSNHKTEALNPKFP